MHLLASYFHDKAYDEAIVMERSPLAFQKTGDGYRNSSQPYKTLYSQGTNKEIGLEMELSGFEPLTFTMPL